jgi:hypothetical protein
MLYVAITQGPEFRTRELRARRRGRGWGRNEEGLELIPVQVFARVR